MEKIESQNENHHCGSEVPLPLYMGCGQEWRFRHVVVADLVEFFFVWNGVKEIRRLKLSYIGYIVERLRCLEKSTMLEKVDGKSRG